MWPHIDLEYIKNENGLGADRLLKSVTKEQRNNTNTGKMVPTQSVTERYYKNKCGIQCGHGEDISQINERTAGTATIDRFIQCLNIFPHGPYLGTVQSSGHFLTFKSIN